MTGQDVVRRLEDGSGAVATLSNEQLKFIASTDFVPKGLRGNMPAIMACVATGRELGLGDMEALRSIHVVDGRPSMSAELMVRLVRRHGHSISGSYGDGQVTAHGRRHDTGDEMEVTWTSAMAQRAGLAGKDNWKKYPEAMLWARAVSQLCRALFPDCLGGVVYTPDEAEMTPEERVDDALGVARPPADAGPDDDALDGEVVEETPAALDEGEQGSFFEQRAREAQERAAQGDEHA